MTAEIIPLHTPEPPVIEGVCIACQSSLWRLQFVEDRTEIVCAECGHLGMYVVDGPDRGDAA